MISAKIAHGNHCVFAKRRVCTNPYLSKVVEEFHCGGETTYIWDSLHFLEELLKEGVVKTTNRRGISFGISKEEADISSRHDLIDWGRCYITRE